MKNPVDDFLEMMVAEKGASQNTVKAYRQDLEQFYDFTGCRDLSSITKEDITEFIQYLSSKRNFATKSISRKLSALREFFKFLFSEKDIQDNPSANLLMPKREKPLPKFLTRDEINKLIEAAESYDDLNHKRMAVMLELMYACGLRVSELVSLLENSINFEKGQILIR